MQQHSSPFDGGIEKFTHAYLTLANERDMFAQALEKIAAGVPDAMAIARHSLALIFQGTPRPVSKQDVLRVVEHHQAQGITALSLAEILLSTRALYCDRHGLGRIITAALDTGELRLGTKLRLFPGQAR